MQIAMIGLGKMGGFMAQRLLMSGHRVVGFNRSPEVTQRLAAEFGLEATFSLPEVKAKLSAPRCVWVMVPSGEATEEVIGQLSTLLEPGDTIIDGGNTYYKDDIRRSVALKEKKLNYIDAGTSGGVWGLKEGYSLMIGGEKQVVENLRPVFESLAPAPDKGWGHVGPVGAGHFVKMVHNGIEYGMMQAYAEGFEIMHAKQDFNLNLEQVAKIWQYGSVIRSWLLDLTANALEADQNLEHIKGWVADSGEGRWTVFEAIDLNVPAPIITLALQARFVSRQDESYAAKLLAAMRNQFGGHAVKTE
ncbi:MAG: 6-phosphogluconate dehydrogenase (decarboxylating) [Chloroflexi bacterium GWB2_49_20]|nr:MAG: 6-phosphogluconate dehydrogenase (decarboxylating) [Chloroflexi bacterium GWB2_49_20]OGN76681.1 MAG: 6-phosphogluconate dehydrogenase (decarboxylating) [Chloroflexi bacterium GWC2_49_37]OGN83641.1 MAG: 6-phosphogluconate dehydrogenase (decarboxylating) [Chloroflexi bacterium GWD2_49_16]HBG74237.1 decarboxylating 6-phosphogluconate dehydrogenase [Anaerolineae bacterium]HCC79443.1 decarboxylating 6-phosphogluconate dehydrogenase [Anaerolineae bacterium]